MSLSLESSTQSSRTLTGRVKWFNNKSGYGFITSQEDNDTNTDIFVHHTSLKVVNDQYRYLVEGEYVDFELEETTTGNHKVQAVNVRGIRGGKLMCETRRDLKMTRTDYRSATVGSASGASEDLMPKQQSVPEEKDWKTVDKRITKKVVKKVTKSINDKSKVKSA